MYQKTGETKELSKKEAIEKEAEEEFENAVD